LTHEVTQWDIFVACLGAMVPFLVIFLTFHLQNRADAKKTAKALDKRNEFADFVMREHSPHSHVERVGPLTTDGIRYPREQD
jgi:hypothetical protein